MRNLPGLIHILSIKSHLETNLSKTSLRLVSVKKFSCPKLVATSGIVWRSNDLVCRLIHNMASKAGAAGIRLRKSSTRGFADHGWLKSYHSFSFAGWYDPKYNGYGVLRVINEDTVAGAEGFPTHGHRNFEIFSYVLSGALEHKDSMGNSEVLKRGDIQFTTAGSGIHHSEYNADAKEHVNFLQIWVKPHSDGLEPHYQTGHFPDESKLNQLRLLISPDGQDGTLKINQDLYMYASLLEDGKAVEHSFRHADGETRRGYLHFPKVHSNKGLKVNDMELAPGDAVFIDSAEKVSITGVADPGERAEFVLFDLV